MIRKQLILVLLILLALTSCTATVDQVTEPITTSSDSIREYIRDCEGFSPVAVYDYKAYSIGYGHTSSDVCEGDTITKDAAIELFKKDIEVFDHAVCQFAADHNITLNQNQFDALVSFCYNLGANCLTRYEAKGYDLIRYLSTGEYTAEELIAEWTSYCHAGGVELTGLKVRRQYEVELFLKNN